MTTRFLAWVIWEVMVPFTEHRWKAIIQPHQSSSCYWVTRAQWWWAQSPSHSSVFTICEHPAGGRKSDLSTMSRSLPSIMKDQAYNINTALKYISFLLFEPYFLLQNLPYFSYMFIVTTYLSPLHKKQNFQWRIQKILSAWQSIWSMITFWMCSYLKLNICHKWI